MTFRLIDFLPFLAVIAGFLTSAWLSESAARLLGAEQKAQVLDAFVSARKAHILAVAVLIALVIWRPWLGWPLVAAYFIGASLWGLWRIRSLNLPKPALHRYVAGQIAIAGGVVLCATLVLLRNYHQMSGQGDR